MNNLPLKFALVIENKNICIKIKMSLLFCLLTLHLSSDWLLPYKVLNTNKYVEMESIIDNCRQRLLYFFEHVGESRRFEKLVFVRNVGGTGAQLNMLPR